MISCKLISLRCGGLCLSATLLLSMLAPGQGQYANHVRHEDSHNIHVWWDNNYNNSDFGRGGLASIGDLNGDGHPEVIIGAPGYTSTTLGQVLIFSGREGKGILATISEAKEVVVSGMQLPRLVMSTVTR